MTSGFRFHGIDYFSPSQANTFRSSPALYLLQYVFKIKGSVGPAAHRGTAGELGIVRGISENALPLDECKRVAVAEFDRLTALSTDPRRDKERAAVEGVVEQGIQELKGYGPPSHAQGEVVYQVDDLPIPLRGFFDLRWDKHGVLTDIKTTHALPSKIAAAHAKQVALYRAASGDNFSARVTYVTPKKAATYELENPREHLDALVRIAQTADRFLALSKDPKELAQLCIPDVDSFYYSDPMLRQAAFDIWGV